MTVRNRFSARSRTERAAPGWLMIATANTATAMNGRTSPGSTSFWCLAAMFLAATMVHGSCHSCRSVQVVQVGGIPPSELSRRTRKSCHGQRVNPAKGRGGGYRFSVEFLWSG